MITALRKIWEFAGEERGNINKSMIMNLIYAIFHMFQIGAIYFIVVALTQGDKSTKAAWISLALLAVSIIGRTVTNKVGQLQQTHAGYFMVANKRVFIGDKLKKVPMGYFNDNNTGEIIGVATTVLDDVENTAPAVLVNILGGLTNTAVFMLMVLIFDWRVGLFVVAGTALYLLITWAMEKKSGELAPHRQKAQASLVGAVLEQVQGMGIIKSFNLTGRGDKRVREALDYSYSSNLNIERLFTPYNIAQEAVLHLFSVAMILAGVTMYLSGSMSLADALMTIIMSFLVFAQVESAGSGMAVLRVAASSIDQANQIDTIPEMDSEGENVRPESHQIKFSGVSFSYDKREILHDINLDIQDKTTTAIIGPSGSGKTTLCNLIPRFWDVSEGVITIGGRDIRDFTLESLTDQISMVFQNVYLFADTIENNIKFGKPNATHQEVVRAAQRACCDEFIKTLPEGYNTVIGEGGASLSGGQRQRVSIARAMIKDAPIIILDEATANVDPENEDRLQLAIEELTRNKTIIMIAHRLKTVRNANQILVVDEGNIVQRGTHVELIGQKGIYADFVTGRKEAIGWKIKI